MFLHCVLSFYATQVEGTGDCLFQSVLRQLDAPAEYTALHLRRQVVYWICQHPRLFLESQREQLRGLYGFAPQVGEEPHGGPYSLKGYLLKQLQATTWGDQCMLAALCMMWDLSATVLHADNFLQLPFRHLRTPMGEVDLVFVYNGTSHYNGAGE